MHIHAKEVIQNVKEVTVRVVGDEQVILHLPDKTSGGAIKPVTKNHPIIEEKYVLFDYTQYENVIL